MTLLYRLNQASIAYGHTPLLDKVTWQLYQGDRVSVIGHNGTGKSTLMRILNREIILDSGELWLKPELRIGYLPQEIPSACMLTVRETVGEGLSYQVELLKKYNQLASIPNLSEDQMGALAELQTKIEEVDAWGVEQRIDTLLSRFQLEGEMPMSSLSGGWRRRVLLAQALVCDPDVLLLDEPTNHLDIDAIIWLEKTLKQFQGAVVFITHDRAFLRNLATKILELDRGHAVDWAENYDRFLIHKEAMLMAEETADKHFDKHLKQEEIWLRQGVKARRTRNEGRVRELESLRQERMSRRERVGSANLSLESASASGKLVASAEQVFFGYHEDQMVIRDFTFQLQRGDKVGIVGDNGSGKSTLINLLIGKIHPTQGKITQGTKLEIAYFDQMRQQLDEEKNLVDNLAEGRDFIDINGKSRHVIGYLQDFLFPPERARTPVKALSGGERARLILAKLFSKPTNMLVLDEPTNDLDIETLELLESLLVSFDGTVLMVSHDREFIDNVVTTTLILEKDGEIQTVIGGYSDWLSQSAQQLTKKISQAQKPEPSQSTNPVAKNPVAKNPVAKSSIAPSHMATTASGTANSLIKLSYKEKLELGAIPERIATIEEKLEALNTQTQLEGFYQRAPQEIDQVFEEIQFLQSECENLYARWSHLEGS